MIWIPHNYSKLLLNSLMIFFRIYYNIETFNKWISEIKKQYQTNIVLSCSKKDKDKIYKDIF